MRLKCPGCNAEMDLDVLLAHEEGRHVLAQLLQLGVPMGALLLRYIGLFRSGKRALAMSRTLALLAELWPDMQRGAITRKGRDWPATPAQWQQAVEAVLAARDKGTLTLPLAGHGYLYEVLLAMVNKTEGVAEREREASHRGRAHAGEAVGVGAVLDAIQAGPKPAGPVIDEPVTSAGPSRYAQKLRAEIAAKRAVTHGESLPGQQTQGG
jgi:hypothetical protein